jgi:tRNA U34 5-methylaminomethyl-2-thiouridine-forming methyltransferase MnmC
MPTDITLVLSKDGSHTLLNTSLNETYHSRNGALQEALHVYIKNGLLVFKELEKVVVLEVGFGTGLNALLTWNKAEELKLKVEYHTLEPLPIEKNITSQLNYPSLLEVDEPHSAERFKHLHEAAWEEAVVMSEFFTIYKYKSTLEEKIVSPNTFNVCYFDAFAPNHQEDVWSETNLKKVYDSLVEGGILTTYCAQSIFKRALRAVGFTVEALDGPKWKREMTWGRKVLSSK